MIFLNYDINLIFFVENYDIDLKSHINNDTQYGFINSITYGTVYGAVWTPLWRFLKQLMNVCTLLKGTFSNVLFYRWDGGNSVWRDQNRI